jgi:2-C-methyl-D-erythritol 2,4-cyclodiphosphate synthase
VRVGIGYDIHAFDPSRPLMLGGLKIEGSWGLRGHSDADVLLHAVGDAILGAAALGDLGDHFPSDDDTWRDAPSAAILAEVRAKARARGLVVGHVDVTLVAERPRIAPHRAAIRDRLAALLGVDVGQVSVKATTNEGLGALGRAEGIAALAVVSLVAAPVPPATGGPEAGR